MGRADEQGWSISEVERLTGLSRRDIQRCCYEGKGGVGILAPEASSWGRRVYGRRDVATLFIVACYRAQGLTLPQVKEVFDSHGGTAGLQGLLDEECERSDDQLAEAIEHSARARAFRASADTAAHGDELADLFRLLATLYLALHPQETGLDDLLAEPGMETLVELWLGPGGYERL